MTEVELLRRFYNIWFRAPTRKEFIACGGKINHVINEYGEYTYMLEQYGYLNNYTGITTIEAKHDDGRIFTGVSGEVAEELGCCDATVRNAVKRVVKKYKGWTLREIPFDVDTFNLYKE